MKSIVVTGATSMIGVALIEACVKENIEVLAIVRRQSVHLDRLPKSSLITICESSLDELESVDIEEKKYDVFYHFAWDYTSKTNRDNPILQEKNIKYTLDAVELAKKLGCRKFIGAGSQAEYGKIDGMIRPDSSVSPLISYGMAKYAAGKLSEKRCSQLGMEFVWGRIFSVYGRYDNEGTMLVYAIDQWLDGNTAKFSAATQMWDYLHEKDAGQIFYLLGKEPVKNGVYCIASGQARPLKEFIMELKDCFGDSAACEFEKPSEHSSLLGLEADISTLKDEIHYAPEIEFAEGVSDMIKFRTKLWNLRNIARGGAK
ncbi:MAG: NAD(P)-dependent oxidoreductase [Eubacteriales bacterium]|nr:NAD(P)-dependent oxidoreductase [Eubacteriales bacterium]